MKLKSILLTIILFSVFSLKAGIEHIMPKPQQVSETNGVFQLNQSIQLVLPSLSESDPAIESQLTQLVESNGGSIVSSTSNQIKVELVSNVAGAEFQDEAYSIAVTPSSVLIKAKTTRGAYWGVQTLIQMAEANNNVLNACEITDWPAFRLRGYMHDIGRSYMEFETLKTHIEKLSRFKINTFHWHLTDNQGWRLQSLVYPELNANSSYTRHAGKYYTIAQAKELVAFGKAHGVDIIPEIDMPGHSEAFRKAMGHVMLTEDGLIKMKNIMTEACETFEGVEWFHIGSDEVRAGDTNGSTISESYFIQQMSAHIRSKGMKVVVWRPGHGYSESDVDMTHMWSSSGSTLGSLPAIDSRYHYINHYDQYADVAGIYNSTIAGQAKGSHQYAGVIVGIWNDRIMPTDHDIVEQNAFYSSVLAIGERAWMGGGHGYITQKGTMIDPLDPQFKDWERRFLFHKKGFLSDEPIAYVKQTNVIWRITDQFPNEGNKSKVFPPESELKSSYDYDGKTYNTRQAIGAAIYLRHVWGTLIPSFFNNPQTNSTAYAYTYVYSPIQQTVGAQIEFQNYGRSEPDLPPPTGKWDYNESKVWVNDSEIAPPAWQNKHTNRSQEIVLKNENFPARPPIQIELNEGWNKVLIKLPNSGFSISQIRLLKWMFTFVFTTPDGSSEVDGLIYSPDKVTNQAQANLIEAIDNARALSTSAQKGFEPGFYSPDVVDNFLAQIALAQSVSESEVANAEYETAMNILVGHINAFKSSFNLPKVSTNEKSYWYSFSTPLRTNNGNNFITFKGNDQNLVAETFNETNEAQQWKVTQNSDGTYNIINRSSDSHISKNSAYNTALKSQSGSPTSAGWTFELSGTANYFIVKSGDVQFNQTNYSPYTVFNWGGGADLTDTGCQYLIRSEDIEGADAFDILQLKIVEAYNALSSTSLGDYIGYYSAEVRLELQNAIDVAVLVKNNPASKLDDAESATSTLNGAIQLYFDSVNKIETSNSSATTWYALTSVRENRTVQYKGDGNVLNGNPYKEYDDSYQWKLIKLDDASFSIVSRHSGSYVEASSPKLKAKSGTQASGGWYFNPIAGTEYFIITSGTSQFNQGNAGTAYDINNWGGGSNTTDEGCRYIIRIIEKELHTGLSNQSKLSQRFWIENGYLKSDKSLNNISIFSILGKQISPKERLPKGIVLIKNNESVIKLVSK